MPDIPIDLDQLDARFLAIVVDQQSSTLDAASEKSAKFTPVPSNVAPSGYGLPGHISMICSCTRSSIHARFSSARYPGGSPSKRYDHHPSATPEADEHNEIRAKRALRAPPRPRRFLRVGRAARQAVAPRKPVVVGGLGQRGVVATASYEARVFGVRSAMPTHEARRRCPHAAFLAGRFAAYRVASRQVMDVLHQLSPLVEPLSLDEAFVDLRAATNPADFSRPGLELLIAQLKDEVQATTNGLTASVGIGTSKFVAKIGSELAKPDGSSIVEAGGELELLRPMKVSVIPGVGPVTQAKLHRIGIHTVADLQGCAPDELAQVIGKTHAQALLELAYARDDRPVEPDRETKSISVEDTFETDLVSRDELTTILLRDARQVASRLRAAGCSPTRCRSRSGCMTSRPSQDHARYSARQIAPM